MDGQTDHFILHQWSFRIRWKVQSGVTHVTARIYDFYMVLKVDMSVNICQIPRERVLNKFRVW